jgi:hypothetical protein
MPFPLLFYWYGARIRKGCKYAAEAEAVFKRMMAASQAQQPLAGQAPVRPEGLPASESRAVLSEDETVVGEGEEMREKRT